MNHQHAKPSLLIVDDTPENLDILKDLLKDSYVIHPARSGVVALRIAKMARPDLILLDLMMPGMDGHEVLRRLRADRATRDIPVIFVTADASVESELQGLDGGAVDYIIKPFHPVVVRARVHTQLALLEARRELAKRNAALQEERELMEDILYRMRSVYADVGPNVRRIESPVERSNGDILIGGTAPDGRQLLFMGDFTGHGLTAAIGAPLAAQIFTRGLRAGMASVQLLEELNFIACRQLPVNIFLAGCLVEIHADRSGGQVWNLGLPEAMLFAQGQAQRGFASRGMPLGIESVLDWDAIGETFEWSPGDLLYVYSDGIVETAAPDGRLFGRGRLEAALLALISRDRPVADLMDMLNKFHGNAEHHDDITLAEIRA